MRKASPTRTDFNVFNRFELRWTDNDQYGHLNNARYIDLMDSAVNAWLISSGALDPAGDLIGLVVENGCSYFSPLAYPGAVEVGIRVARTGRTSVTYEAGIFAEGSEAAAALAFMIHVWVDAEKRRPVAIPSRLVMPLSL